MPMQMGFRWYGEGNDKISLQDIRQIPGVSTIVWALHNKMPGEIWQPEEIKKVVDQITAAGFNADVVESVNVHDDIKIGLPTRDGYIENYITSSSFPQALIITLKYTDGAESAIRGLKRESKPGLRKFVGVTEIPAVLGGMGLAVLSTSQGVMSGKDAKAKKLGGELSCTVW